MEQICPADLCTACTACYSVCPKNAIEMQPDTFGNIHPHINSDLCIDCKACVKICPVNNPVQLNEPKISLAAFTKDINDRKSCASGGVSFVLCTAIIKEGGIVFGCAQNNAYDIKHERFDNLSDLNKLKGSKYVHSPLGNTYKNVLSDLKSGKKVLFTGTPCQCAGLKSFLRKDYPNLFVVDICCHGVVSQQLLHDELLSIKKNKSLKLEDNDTFVRFREKINIKKGKFEKSEIKYGLFLYYRGKKLYCKCVPDNNYIAGFLSGIFFRENCFTCVYASKERVSDITLADHWGMGESENKEMNVHKGLSTILVNTERGRYLLRQIENDIIYEERSLDESINGNGQFIQAFEKPKNHDSFISDYINKGYEYACKVNLHDYKKQYKEYFLRIKLIHIVKKIPFAKYIIDKLKNT